MMPQGASLKSEETESQAEKEVIPENEIKIIFEEDSPDEFFSKAVDLAVSDPMKFASTYKEFFRGENYPDKEAPDGRLNALRVFAWGYANADNELDPEKRKEELIQKIKEAEEFYGSMEQRKKEIPEKVKRVSEELSIQEHSRPLSEQEVEESIKSFQSIFSEGEKSKNFGLFARYYLYATRGEFGMPSSSPYLDRQRTQDSNERVGSVIDNPEESKLVMQAVSEQIGRIIKGSNDSEKIAEINLENLNATQICMLLEGDFLHGSSIDSLDQIRKRGFLCREILDPNYDSMSMNRVSVSFGRQKEAVNEKLERNNYNNECIKQINKDTFFRKYRGNIARDYGAYDESTEWQLRFGEKKTRGANEDELYGRQSKISDIKVAGENAMTYIVREQDFSYELFANADTSHADEYCVGIGVPSTEIKGVIVDASSEKAIKKVLSKLAEFPFYIPAYDSETGVLLNEKMKELYK